MTNPTIITSAEIPQKVRVTNIRLAEIPQGVKATIYTLAGKYLGFNLTTLYRAEHQTTLVLIIKCILY